MHRAAVWEEAAREEVSACAEFQRDLSVDLKTFHSTGLGPPRLSVWDVIGAGDNPAHRFSFAVKAELDAVFVV